MFDNETNWIGVNRNDQRDEVKIIQTIPVVSNDVPDSGYRIFRGGEQNRN